VTLQVIDRSRWPDVRPQETRRAGTNALLPDGELLTLAMLSQWPLLTLRRRPPASNAQFGRPIRHLADLPPDLPNCASTLSDLMRPWLARPSATLTGDRLPIAAGNCEGERVTSGVRLCHGVRVPFISAQDHARNRLLHALYAPRKRLSSTLGPRLATGMRDAACELLRISVPRTSLNKGHEDTGNAERVTDSLVTHRLLFP
jgi:hypothetical protein